MKHYLLTCGCGAGIPVTAGQAGGRVRCSSCAAECEVPRLGALTLLEATPEPRRAARRWGGWHAAALACAVVAVLAGATGAAAFARARTLAAIDPERMRQAVAATDVVEIHRSMEALARRGIVRDLSPPEQALLRHAGWLVAMSRAAWGVAAASGMLAVVAGIVAAAAGPRPEPTGQRRPLED